MKRVAIALAAALLVTAAGAGIWILSAGNGHATADDPPPFHGQGRQFTLLEPVEPAPLAPIETAEGGLTDLKDYRGRVVLLNFWATWCAPCLEEMPSLDALEADLGSEGLAVLALNIDREGFDAARPFYEREDIETLPLLVDLQRKNFYAYGMQNHPMPTSFLIDHEGRLVGYLEGPAEWDSAEAKALIRYYLERRPAGEG